MPANRDRLLPSNLRGCCLEKCVCMPWHTVFSVAKLQERETCTKTLRKSSFLAWSLHVLTFLQKPFLTIYSWIRVLRFSLSIFRCVAMAKGEVACDLVEDYLPNGTSLGWVQPSVKCAASHDQCPCRGAQ